MAVEGNRLYVGTVVGPSSAPGWSPYAAVLYSTDSGDSWTDITPDTPPYSNKLIAAAEVAAVGKTLMVVGAVGVLLSYDGGETWIEHRRTSGASPIVALDENNFYKTDHRKITRSTDGGITWHPFSAQNGMAFSVFNMPISRSSIFSPDVLTHFTGEVCDSPFSRSTQSLPRGSPCKS